MGFPDTMHDTPHASIDMERLLNPTYWGGLILGMDPDRGPSTPKADEASAHFAIAALETVLASGVRSESLQTYAPGSTFIPDEQAAGTVVVYHQETLFRQEPDRPMADMKKFTRRAAPKGPSELELEFDNPSQVSFQPRHTIDGGAVHREEVRYGVVPPDYGRQRSRLITISGMSVNHSVHKRSVSAVKKGKRGSVVVDSDRPYPRVEYEPIAIGGVRHFIKARPKRPDNPRLVKINRLEVLRFGQAS